MSLTRRRADGRRSPGVFVSWIPHHGRSADLAAELGLEAAFVAAGVPGRPHTAPLRHAVQATRTAALVLARRPGAVVAMAPPLPLVLLLLALRWRLRFTLVADAHTKAVLRRGRPARAFLRLARRLDAVVVAAPTLAPVVAGAGGRALVVHDPVAPRPGSSAAVPAGPPSAGGGPFEAVFPATWSDDEPVEQLLDAAALMGDDVRVVVTGRPDRRRLRRPLPANVELTGFLDRAVFDRRLASAGAVLALTTREHTMQRAGYEAVAAGVPLVVSGTAALREYFGEAAVSTGHDPAELAAAVLECRNRRVELAAAVSALRDRRLDEHRRAVAALSDVLAARA